MSFEDKGDSLASDGLFTPFFVSLHISPLPLPRLLLPHDFPGIFYADFDVAVPILVCRGHEIRLQRRPAGNHQATGMAHLTAIAGLRQ